jgi:hypothetical protein
MYVQLYVRWVKGLHTLDSALKRTQFRRAAQPNWRIQTTHLELKLETKMEREKEKKYYHDG